MVIELQNARSRVRLASRSEGTPSAGQLGAKATATGAERRREPRYPCNDPVEVRLASGDRATVSATLLGVSRSGLQIEIATALARNTQIEILFPNQLTISGKVKHSRRVGAKYEAGVLIQETSDSSKLPEHISAQQLDSYLNGRGLTLTQVIRVRGHLASCSACRLRVVDAYSVKPRRSSE